MNINTSLYVADRNDDDVASGKMINVHVFLMLPPQARASMCTIGPNTSKMSERLFVCLFADSHAHPHTDGPSNGAAAAASTATLRRMNNKVAGRAREQR